eukprot:6490204-Prymnesium_polylepis.2
MYGPVRLALGSALAEPLRIYRHGRSALWPVAECAQGPGHSAQAQHSHRYVRRVAGLAARL